jgi:hypothetical protein
MGFLLTILTMSRVVVSSQAWGQSGLEKTPGTIIHCTCWVTAAVIAPGVTHHVFQSASIKGEASYHFYRSSAYKGPHERRFPVVYWLHGSSGGLPGISTVALWRAPRRYRARELWKRSEKRILTTSTMSASA